MNHAVRRLATTGGKCFALTCGIACTGTGLRGHPPTRLDYWEHNRQEFDLYLDRPTEDDLPMLLNEFEKGKDVWPWIWCQRNENGPHHVFAGILTIDVLDNIENLLKNRQNNVLIITTPEQVRAVPRERIERCGLVTDAQIKLVNLSAKILMLDDERVVCFDQLIVSS